MIPDQDFLKVEQVLDLLAAAIDQKDAFSLVRIGDGENQILAQGSVMPIEDVLNRGWAKAANEGKKGVTLPNLKLRDEMAESIKMADVVGIPFWKDDPILADQAVKRPLTEAVFKHFNILPDKICHTFVNRVFTQKEEFWHLLKGKRILLIGSWSDKVKPILEKSPYGLCIALTLDFSDYTQMEETLQKVIQIKDEFDIALVSCGVNAVVLAPQIARFTGKVAIDFGKSLMFMVQNKAGLKYYSHQSNLHLIPYSILLIPFKERELLMPEATDRTDERGVSIVVSTNKLNFAANIFTNYHNQTWIKKELIIILNNDSLNISEWESLAGSDESISVYQLPEYENLGACLTFAINRAKYEFIAKFDDDDYYAPLYLSEALQVLDKTNADIVGKRSLYMYMTEKKLLLLRHPSRESRPSKLVGGGTLVCKREVFQAVPFKNQQVGTMIRFVRDCGKKGFTVYSSSRFNYTYLRREDDSHTWNPGEKYFFKTSKIITVTSDYQKIVSNNISEDV